MRGPTFIDLFAGAGGLSAGLRIAGWKSLLATDSWSDAVRTYESNNPSTRVWREDVRSLSGRTLSRVLAESPEWIVGGPPCQGFSTVGKRWRADERNRLVHEFHRIVKEIRPRGFLIENVLGLKDMQFVSQIERMFGELGFEVATHVLTSADHGVPQLRRRVVFVGDRDGRFFLGPEKKLEVASYVSVQDAIGDLPELLPGERKDEYTRPPRTNYQRLMRRGSSQLQGHQASVHPRDLVRAISFIPDGGNRYAIPSRYQPRSGFHNSYSRLSSRLPAVAVTQNMGKPSGTRCIHPTQNRGLTAREGARLQSFPDTYHFFGGMISQRLQIANAVPPLLGQALGEAIVDRRRWSTRTKRVSERGHTVEVAV